MSTVLGAVVTGAVLGITHAIEPDHVAGVASLTGRSGGRRRSAIVGTCFALGHVVLVLAWLLLGYVFLGRTAFGRIFDVVGTLGVAVLLGLLGATMTVGGLRSFVHRHDHAHGDGNVHAHPHVHLPLIGEASAHDHEDPAGSGSVDAACIDGPGTHSPHDHDHSIRQYIVTGVVGALFTLSPPLSMIAFTATILPTQGVTAVGAAMVAYTIGIGVTMGSLGAGVGSIVDATDDRPAMYSVFRTIAGVLVLVVAVSVVLS
jgi:ABC-type nickel/cobalt efflux system permease component RcnA